MSAAAAAGEFTCTNILFWLPWVLALRLPSRLPPSEPPALDDLELPRFSAGAKALPLSLSVASAAVGRSST